MVKVLHNHQDISMQKEVLNEINEMKYLFGYKPGRVISEQAQNTGNELFPNAPKLDATSIQNVNQSMIAADPFEGQFIGAPSGVARDGENQKQTRKVFGGTFNGTQYAWDITNVAGTDNIWANPSPSNGNVISVGYDYFTNEHEYKMRIQNNDPNAPKQNSPGVGFQSNNITFLCYITTNGTPYCETI